MEAPVYIGDVKLVAARAEPRLAAAVRVGGGLAGGGAGRVPGCAAAASSLDSPASPASASDVSALTASSSGSGSGSASLSGFFFFLRSFFLIFLRSCISCRGHIRRAMLASAAFSAAARSSAVGGPSVRAPAAGAAPLPLCLSLFSANLSLPSIWRQEFGQQTKQHAVTWQLVMSNDKGQRQVDEIKPRNGRIHNGAKTLNPRLTTPNARQGSRAIGGFQVHLQIKNTGGQRQQLAYKVRVAGLHCQVERCVPLLLFGASAVQQLGHRLHVPVLGCQLQCCDALGVLQSQGRCVLKSVRRKVGLQHVPDQDPNSISVTLLSSPVQAQPLLLVLHPNVAAQGHQLGHHCGVTPQAGPHEDVPPIAALVLNGQPQRSQQLNQLQITRPCIIGSEFANVPTIAAQVYRREVSSSASSKSPNPASVQCRCQRPTHSSLGREWTTPEKPAAGPAPNHQNLCHVL
ncbi:MAG: hypothetical protein FRX49_06534 [Trebouxia sp. A1-2]|nr:MAG: hypothetical protein FRX49_06534 [Trebouxia sp. A1-2]